MEKTVTLQLPDGDKYLVTGALNDRSIIGAIELSEGFYERNVMEIIREVVKPNFVCMDIGANIGVLSIAIAKSAFAGKVYSIEVSTINHAYLSKNIKDNKLNNCMAIHCGVSDRREVVNFNYVEEVAGCSFISPLGIEAGHSEVVELVTIDEIVLNNEIGHVDFIKLDVEGGERKALQGAKALLMRNKPLLLIEFNPTPIQRFYGEDPQTLFDLLKKYYRYIYIIKFPSGGLKLIETFEILMAFVSSGKGWEDLLCSPDAITSEKGWKLVDEI